MDFETCDAEVFAAVEEILEQRAREAKREQLARDVRDRMGR